jgi:hypothetical protein
MNDDLVAIADPRAQVVSLHGVDITITPLRVQQVAKLAALAKDFFPAVREKIQAGAVLEKDKFSVPAPVVLDLVGTHFDDLVQLSAILSCQPIQKIADLELDAFLSLISAILKVNADFFIQRLAPQISQLMAEASRLNSLNTAGLGSSNGS